MENKTIKDILSRTSVRKYSDKKVNKSDIDTILKCAMSAPSAKNMQPWRIVVITDREILDAIAKEHPYCKMAGLVDYGILVCGDMDKTLDGIEKDFWVQDCSAMTENILISAKSLELGAVWVGVYPVQDRMDIFTNLLNTPNNLVPFSFIPIGYPLRDKEPMDKFREDNIHYNKF